MLSTRFEVYIFNNHGTAFAVYKLSKFYNPSNSDTMNQFQHKLVIMLAVFVGSIVGLFKGTEARQKWVYKIKSRYEDKRQTAVRKTLKAGEVMLDDIELAAFHNN